MTPEIAQIIAQLQTQVGELLMWKAMRENQQISLPVDNASKAALGAYFREGIGNHALTQTITIGAGGGSANVPAAYAGTRFIIAEGERIEIPIL